MLNCESSEAKQTCSIVEKIISKRSEHVYIEEFKYRSEAKTFVSSKIYFEVKRTCLYVRNIEAKRRKLTLTCYLAKQSEHSYFKNQMGEAKCIGLF
jgi:hypothetical protein